MPMYRKRPIIVEARRWDGTPEGAADIIAWIESYDSVALHHLDEDRLVIGTLEGSLALKPGAYVIRGIRNEFYPHDEEIFTEVYELVEHGQAELIRKPGTCACCGAPATNGDLAYCQECIDAGCP